MDYSLPHFRIDFRDWMKGNNLYDAYPNGGLLASENGYNPFKYPGDLVAAPDYPTAAVTSNLKRAIIANGLNTDLTAGAGTSSNVGAVAIALDGDPNTAAHGYYYQVHPTTGAFTLGATALSSKNYRLGYTEAEFIYASYTLVTNDTNIAFIDPIAAGPLDVSETWASTVGGMSTSAWVSSNPHPMGRFEDFVYAGDGDSLTQIDGFTVTSRYFTGIPQGYTVTALVQHRGYLLIAATEHFLSLGTTTNGKFQTRILLWDGFSPSYSDDILVDDQITAMVAGNDGVIYVWTVKHFGYLNGSRFEKLRTVNNRVYKHMVTPVTDGIMYADGTTLVRYSSAIPGGKKYFFVQNTTADTITNIIQVVTDVPIICTDGGNAGHAKNLLYTGLDTGVSATAKTFTFNPRLVRVPVKLRHVVIETDGLSTGSIAIGYIDSDGNTQTVGTFDGTGAQAGKRVWHFDAFSLPDTRRITPVVTMNGDAKLRSIDFYYQPVGSANNS